MRSPTFFRSFGSSISRKHTQDSEGLAQAKKSAIFIAVAIFLIQPLSFSVNFIFLRMSLRELVSK